ncbi:MAG: hypothetical protein ACK50E_02805 [Bacteroidota bacterium]|jgi:hypothetical protein
MNNYLKTKEEIQSLLDSLSNFKKEIFAITLIKEAISVPDCSSINLDEIRFEFWKYYRTYKMKEFILLFSDRINSEKSTIDSTSNKTIEMLDEAFLWNITNWSYGSVKKYEQRYYSSKVLNFKMEPQWFENLSITNQNIFIQFLNKLDIRYIGDEIKAHPNSDDKKGSNKKIISRVNKFLNTNEITFLEILKISKEKNEKENLQSLIHAVACQKGSLIQLDHVLNRITIKNYIEELCCKISKVEIDEKIKSIDIDINVILPFMFGCVVMKEENDKLKNYLDITDICSENLWEEYKKQGIKIYDFNQPEIVIEGNIYDTIKIEDTYDLINLSSCGKSYKWNKLKNIWEDIAHNSV